MDYFGEQLAAQGYSYYGSEALYSGVSGTLMHADIYMGVVYYQRLRHMVSDKSQVRAVGPVNSLTRQPIKGRKRHGGIRLGEMERDALLAHGSSFLLMDRLMNCSDRHIAHVCSGCGSLLSPTHTFVHDSSLASSSSSSSASAAMAPGSRSMHAQKGRGATSNTMGGGGANPAGKFVCKVCADAATCEPIALPYVFRYLANELAGMGVRITLELDQFK